MAQIKYMHIYDKTISILIKYPLGIALFASIGFLLVGLEEIFEISGENENVNIAIGIGLFLVSSILSIFIYEKLFAKLFFTLSAYLYIRFSLKTKITWKQTKMVDWLFVVNDRGVWYPMKEVKQLEEKERVNYILIFANRLFHQ
jgi:hypothetical protein